MSQELAATEKELTVTESVDSVPWMRRYLPASFFTSKVMDNRKAETVPLPTRPQPKSRWQPVTRRLSGGRTTHVALHLKLDDRSFYFRCPCRDIPLPIDRDRLMTAIAAVHGNEWVHVRVGTESLCLNRAELRAAFNTIEI